MFSRIFRRGEGFRRLLGEFGRTVARAIARPGDRRIAGILIAHLDR